MKSRTSYYLCKKEKKLMGLVNSSSHGNSAGHSFWTPQKINNVIVIVCVRIPTNRNQCLSLINVRWLLVYPKVREQFMIEVASLVFTLNDYPHKLTTNRHPSLFRTIKLFLKWKEHTIQLNTYKHKDSDYGVYYCGRKYSSNIIISWRPNRLESHKQDALKEKQ